MNVPEYNAARHLETEVEFCRNYPQYGTVIRGVGDLIRELKATGLTHKQATMLVQHEATSWMAKA